MITQEVNDAHLNFKKILYESEKAVLKDKDREFAKMTSQKPDMQLDDENRLVIDISENEKEENKHLIRQKSMLSSSTESENIESSK